MFRSVLLLILISFVAGCDKTTATEESSSGSQLAGVLHHDMDIKLSPEQGLLSVTNRVRVPAGVDSFYLASGLVVSVDGQPLKALETRAGVSRYRWPDVGESGLVELQYSGKLTSTDQCDWLRQACRLLNQRGVYLDAASDWYPQSPGMLHSFTMEVTTPEGWVSLSQGRPTNGGWAESQPQDGIYLLAGPFSVYEDRQGEQHAMVYLQQPDPALAETYLKATHRYLKQYSEMIGPYPYAKFATVESFWETGWGMPSFTLLGPQVLRLPFIPYTSLPHEVLHNWWGNGVFIDATEGNWSEGLTAYLSDHLMRKARGSDAGYRRDTLQKFSVFTEGGEGFPLAAFRSRHNQATQAVGYGKSLMLFHILNNTIGEDVFEAGLQRFYGDHAFTPASFGDLQRSFEAASGQSLEDFFRQWLLRKDAPLLSLLSVDQAGDVLTIKLSQHAAEGAYDLRVPVRMTLNSGSVETKWLHLIKPEQSFDLDVAGPVVEVAVDPDFDVMRIPHPQELPLSLNSLFAADTVYYLPSTLEVGLQEGVRAWLEAMEKRGQKVVPIESLDKAPEGAVVLQVLPVDAQRFGEELSSPWNPETQSAMLAVTETGRTLIQGWAPSEDALRVLLRKAPHYGKYSYVVFDANTGKNVAKGQWPVTSSPLLWQR